MRTNVKQCNTLEASWNITSLKCKHTDRWYSQQEAVLFYKQGQQLSVCPNHFCQLKVQTLKPSTQGAWLPNLVRWSVNASATREQNSMSAPYQWELFPQTPAFSCQRETLERVILFMNLIFLQHALHYWALLHNSNSYLCFACLFCLSGVHHQVFVDKISRDGCSTYYQLTFLVANYWEKKEHAVEIFIKNCTYKVLFTKTWEQSVSWRLLLAHIGISLTLSQLLKVHIAASVTARLLLLQFSILPKCKDFLFVFNKIALSAKHAGDVTLRFLHSWCSREGVHFRSLGPF